MLSLLSLYKKLLPSRLNPFAEENPMYVNSAQKFFTYAGYYMNGFARESVRDIERLTHPMPQGEGHWEEVKERAKRVGLAALSIPLAAALFVPSLTCYAIAACVGRGRFELIQPKSPVNFWQGRSVKVLSLNACFQDPWSPLTGGVVPPFEPVGHCASRIAAIVDAIGKKAPDICMGQEFENLGAQDEFIRLMRQKGFLYFLRDLGSNDPIRNNSGLFAASKAPFQNVKFVPYPPEDRAGLAKWSNQGALTFSVSTEEKALTFVNVHLNYGEGEENQSARNRQLKRHAIPLLNKGPSVLLGDLNFDTAKVDRATNGLLEFTNALEGLTTCTDEGKHILRGKDRNPGGKPCTDCQEKIDGLIYDPARVEVLDSHVEPFKLNHQFLSDHYATLANVRARD
jgi:endonuclease/exonuclease/phosphatase family metal-dependent hydrolase